MQSAKKVTLKIDIENYSGPLEVLLDLAKSQKVDLANISITQLADQFIEFINSVKKINLDLASEYLLMATWLVYLKSKLLLPQSDEDDFKVSEVAERLKLQLRKLELIRLLSDELLKEKSFTNIDDTKPNFNLPMMKKLYRPSQRPIIKSQKLTYIDDLNKLKCLKPAPKDIFIGTGYDIHPFEANKKMFLGGVHIKSDIGFKAHSDGDVLIHSLIDAILGAAQAGDIGEFFPDNDPKYKGIDSKKLLKYVVNLIEKTGFEVVNIDITIIAQTPKLSPYKKEMKNSLKQLTNCENINIKATTNEKMGFIGRGEGIAVISTATLKYKDWYEHYNSRK